MSTDGFPRVLLVYPTPISQANPSTQHLVVWFRDWPRERLAQVCSGAGASGDLMAGSVYTLGPADRRLGRRMQKHRSEVVSDAGSVQELMGQVPTSFKARLARWVVRSGLWEVVFRVRLSGDLRRFVERFNPDVIYVQGYLLGFCDLPQILSTCTGKPICFHTTDDWPAYLYADTPARWFMRPLVNRAARALIQRSSVRLAFTTAMKREYEARYAVPFHDTIGPVVDDVPISGSDDATQRATGHATVVCLGSLQMDRWRGAIDMARAVAQLREKGQNVRFVCYSLDAPDAAVQKLQELGARMKPPVPVNEVPAILAAADILFLPEAFDQTVGKWIALSLSSKVPYFVMARRPVIVYGSPLSGVAQHAAAEGWGEVIGEPDVDRLEGVVSRMLKEGPQREHKPEIIHRYEASHVRERLRSLLQQFSGNSVSGSVKE